MSYFQKHAVKVSHCYEPQNSKPVQSNKQKRIYFNAKTEPNQQPAKHQKHKQFNDIGLFGSKNDRSPLKARQSAPKETLKQMAERELPGLMLEGENSMQELLNSSINQFTKYLSDRDSFEEEHQQLLAQNKDLKKTLDKLKTIIKQKLVSALNKQKQELNAVMEDYVQLITKLLADKEQLTAALEELEKKLNETQQKCEVLSKSQIQSQAKIEELARDREQHIAKTKQQIDDFLQIIEQYQEEADQDGDQKQLKQRIVELEKQLQEANLKLDQSRQSLPPKTQILLQMLQKAQEENRILREKCNQQCWSERAYQIQKEHEQQFIEYERAMRETINKKDECISRLNSIIQNYREGRGKDPFSSAGSQITGHF